MKLETSRVAQPSSAVFCLSAAMLLTVAGCHSTSPPPPREAAALTATVSAAEPAPSRNLAPPTEDEVRQALRRVFGAQLTISSIGGERTFITTDLNGDGYEDLAVRIRASAAMANEDSTGLANWITEDPNNVQLPDPARRAQPLPAAPAPIHLRPGEELLVILHGYGPQGWRSPEARQAYVLIHSPLDDLTSFPVQEISRLQRYPRFPWLKEVLCSRAASGECFFWNGAGYSSYRVASETANR